MVVMAISVAAVEEEVRDRILALDASAYNQGSVTAEWSEVRQLGTLGGAAGHLDHLRFQGAVTGSPSANGEREAPNGEARVVSRLEVSFTYVLRPSEQIADSRLARNAAQDIIQALNAYHDEWDMVLLDAGRPSVAVDGRLLAMNLSFDVYHNIEV